MHVYTIGCTVMYCTSYILCCAPCIVYSVHRVYCRLSVVSNEISGAGLCDLADSLRKESVCSAAVHLGQPSTRLMHHCESLFCYVVVCLLPAPRVIASRDLRIGRLRSNRIIWNRIKRDVRNYRFLIPILKHIKQ